MAKRIESPSSINTFKQCKRKYYYQYIEKLPTIPNVHQIRGNIAHSSLEEFFDIDVSQYTPEIYKNNFQKAIQTIFLFNWNKYRQRLDAVNLSNDQKKFYFEETMLMLLNWTNHFIREITDQIKEKKISVQEAFTKLTPIREQQLKSEGHSVRGFIDAIKHVDEEVHIIDYKTNSCFEFKEEIKLQLAIYSLLYEELHGKMPSKVGVFFLRHKLKMINVDQELLELAKREIKIVHAHTSSTERIDDYPTTITNLCKWSAGRCDFYELCRPHKK